MSGCEKSDLPPPAPVEPVRLQRPAFCRGVALPPLRDDLRRSWAERTAAAVEASARADACGRWIETHYGRAQR